MEIKQKGNPLIGKVIKSVVTAIYFTITINRDWMIQCQYCPDILGAFASYHSTNEQYGQYSVKTITTSLSLPRNSQ